MITIYLYVILVGVILIGVIYLYVILIDVILNGVIYQWYQCDVIYI
jgi:hypothetical protein